MRQRFAKIFEQPPLRFINPEMAWTDVVKYLILLDILASPERIPESIVGDLTVICD